MHSVLFPRGLFVNAGELHDIPGRLPQRKVETETPLPVGEGLSLAEFQIEGSQSTPEVFLLLERLAAGTIMRVNYTDIYGSNFDPFEFIFAEVVE